MTRPLAVLLLLTALPTGAQTPSDLLRCAGIARDKDRLACFDALVARSAEGRVAAEARAAETARIASEEAAAAAAAAAARAQAEQQAKREGFGKPAADADEVREVETTLTELLTNQSGLGVFLLGNGQLWRQVDTASLPRLKPGDPVKLTRAGLGGFRLEFPTRGNRWVAAKRIR